MKILHIVNSLDCGGLENFTIELSKELMRSGDLAYICCLDKLGNLASNAIESGVSVVNMKIRAGFDLSCIVRLRRYIKLNNIDVVHTHNKKPLIYGTIAAKLAGVSSIVHTRHGQAPDSVPWYIWAMNSKIVTISEDAKIQLIKNNKLKMSQVDVIKNGIPINKFESIQPADSFVLKEAMGITPKHQVIGIVARLAVEKDHRTLIMAFAEVVKVNANAILIIVGDGPLSLELQTLSNEWSLNQNIKFLGFRQDIAALIATFDIFALSSTSEGMSLTLLEAMAAKKPIVATDVGGNPEVVKNNVTGIIVPPKEPKKMADALSTLLSDAEKSKKFGMNGYYRVKEEFSLEAMTLKYKAMYAGQK